MGGLGIRKEWRKTVRPSPGIAGLFPIFVTRLSEDSVEVNLARIDLPRLARLVDALERGPGVVKVRRIRLATRNDDPSLVDVTLQVATWQLKT